MYCYTERPIKIHQECCPPCAIAPLLFVLLLPPPLFVLLRPLLLQSSSLLRSCLAVYADHWPDLLAPGEVVLLLQALVGLGMTNSSSRPSDLIAKVGPFVVILLEHCQPVCHSPCIECLYLPVAGMSDELGQGPCRLQFCSCSNPKNVFPSRYSSSGSSSTRSRGH